MVTKTIEDEFFSLYNVLGRAAFNSLYPDEIEIYFLAFELTTIEGDSENTDEYFLFPIMPSQITFNQQFLINFDKTNNGLVVNSNNSYNPSDININGNFGRILKILVRNTPNTFRAVTKKIEEGKIENEFSQNIKTGYGCLKVLQRILDKSNQIAPNGKPYKLYFYNLSNNDNFLVKCVSYNVTQTEQMSVLHQYNIQLKGLQRIDKKLTKENIKYIALGAASQRVNNLVSKVQNYVLENDKKKQNLIRSIL